MFPSVHSLLLQYFSYFFVRLSFLNHRSDGFFILTNFLVPFSHGLQQNIQHHQNLRSSLPRSQNIFPISSPCKHVSFLLVLPELNHLHLQCIFISFLNPRYVLIQLSFPEMHFYFILQGMIPPILHHCALQNRFTHYKHSIIIILINE